MAIPKPRTCYVSIPFGRKHDIDFDTIYSKSLAPILAEFGLQSTRGDDFIGAGIIQKSIFEAVLSSDVMVADVTGLNPNVQYELGIRHALRRRTTLVILESLTRLPFNINSIPAIRYELTDEGKFTDASCERLKRYLDRLLSSDLDDSPLFTFFPELKVELPRSPFEEPRMRDFDDLRGKIEEARQLIDRDSLIHRLAELEKPVLKLDSLQTTTDLIMAYRDALAWDEMVDYYQRLPESVTHERIVQQQVALALSRRDRPGDQQWAMEILQEQIDRHGDEPEAYTLLGLLHKRLYVDSSDENHLDSAIDSYRKGYELGTEEYPGINLAYLLDERLARTGSIDDSTELKQLLRRLKHSLKGRMISERASYWDSAALLETLCLGRDWESAQDLIPVLRRRAADQWMLDSTSAVLMTIRPRLTEEDSRSRLDAITSELHRPLKAEASSI